MENIENYKCPCCGAPLVYSGKSESLHCKSCGNDYSAETMEQLLEAEAGAQSKSKFDWGKYEPREFDDAEKEELVSYNCPSCGAEITGDDTMGSTICPYCGNSTVIKGTFEGAAKPDCILPFKLEKSDAMAKFEEDCNNRPFLPDEFKDKKKISEMSGVYVPFWMFDCDCDASITYNAQRHTMWSDSQYDYEKTDYFKLYREGSVAFNNIPVDASQKAEDNYMDALEPFRYEEAVDFSQGYLSGYLADKYDVSVDDSVGRANERVKNSTEEVFRDTTAGYSLVTPEHSSIQFSDGKVRYAMVPVWMLNIKYNDKMYKYAINGQTGKVVGEFPIDKSKKRKYFWKNFGITFVIAAAVSSLITYFVL